MILSCPKPLRFAKREAMGMIYVTMRVSDGSSRVRRVKFLVDSGAIMSVLPEKDWKTLRLRGRETIEFVLADGTPIRRKVAECRFYHQGIERWSPVVLGSGRDVALLGSLTLETMGLALHPLERRLRPMRMMLAAAS